MSGQSGIANGSVDHINVGLARQMVEDERHQCLTCTSEAQENNQYCWYCDQYWKDVCNGLFDDPPDYNIHGI